MNKFNIYTLFLLALTMCFACDPMEDDLEEINASSSGFVKDVTYTLTEDDYDLINDECECTGYGTFSTEDEAKEYVPFALNSAFPAFGAGSSAVVTYALYHGSSPDLRGDYNAYTVTDAEYAELGFTYGNFSNLTADIPKYATYKQPDAGDGDYMDIEHAFYSSSTGAVPDTTSRAGYTVAYGWMYAEILPDNVYGDYFGESGIDFSNEDEGVEKIPVYLKDTYKFVNEGDRKLIQFNYDNGEDTDPTTPAFVIYEFDGMDWISYGAAFQTTDVTLSFGKVGDTWVPDNTIKYTLSGADFTVIGTNTAESNPGGSASVLQYGNFDLSLWSEEQIIAALNEFMLDSSTFIKEVDQKYLITYATYNPAGASDILLIYDGENFVKVEE
ncbi:hypothetical protein BFP72_03925 [Reichenbachiella sp. 5M10]|uniref:hypothetical protein n=1 Tax=Reichenbachiella sp. 5M10 TaxID=1889772 RepID=UPI000C152EF0|nr:hypothetical protein [Reichenbachiella sp. 5M10]PIB34615.1 hypothetical protein BFP72_03925 [Reichenbachiella sp. 5M10]